MAQQEEVQADSASGENAHSTEKQEEKGKSGNEGNAYERFEDLCRRLNLDEECSRSGWELVEQFLAIVEGDNTRDNERYWFACAHYIAGKKKISNVKGELSTGNAVSLSQLLRETNLRLVDFFEPLKIFINKLQLGEQFERDLKLLEKKFVVICILFQKYQKVYTELFGSYLPAEDNEFSFGWNLFLVAKRKLLPDPYDLVHAFHLLLCCLNLLLVCMPEKLQLKSSSDEELPKNLEGALLSLCERSGADFQAVSYCNTQLFRGLLLNFLKHRILKHSENTTKRNGEEITSLDEVTLSGLFSPACLKRNIQSLNREYDLQHLNSGEFDERLFLGPKDQIGTPSKLSAQSCQYYMYQSSQSPNELDKANPASASADSAATCPKTPMSATLESVSWLNTTLTQRMAKPSETLLRFFSVCTVNPLQSVETRVKNLTESIQFPQDANERRELGIKLYYKVLESMLIAEENRLGQSNFTTLLNNDSFHRSLLACSMEIVFYSYKMISMSFPFIIHHFDLKPFEFCKIIESFIRHEKQLPKPLIKHLSRSEERILESMAWEEGSPVYTLLQEEDRAQNILAMSLGWLQNLSSTNSTVATPNSSSFQGFSTPVLPKAPRNQIATPTKQNGATERQTSTSSSHSLELFFRKLLILAQIRIRDLCNRLQMPTKLVTQILKVLIHVMVEHSSMMRNRKMDQIIMCSLFSISRVNDMPSMTFKKIIEKYREQPQAHSSVYREVVLDRPDKKGDIIKFYNSVFIPAMENFLLQLVSETPNGVSISTTNSNMLKPPAPSFGQRPSPLGVFSPRGVPPSPLKTASNVIVSPLRRTQSTESTRTPRSVSYNIGESPAKDLQQINQNVNRLSSRRKRLQFDNVEDPSKKQKHTMNNEEHHNCDLAISAAEGIQELASTMKE